MSSTRRPASTISSRPRLVRSISLARPSDGSGRRVRKPISARSLTSSDAAARLSCARPASSVSRMPSRSDAGCLDFVTIVENTTVTEVSVPEVNWRVAMVTPSPDFVSTDLGRLHVRRAGDGPPVVLWPSLFVDSRSWGPLFDELAGRHTVYAIDGPSHGRSESVPRDFTFEEVVTSAEQALDRLGLTEPVDWVGNAWGGHVGIRLATGPRLRTLTTIGTPIQGFTMGEKLTKAWPLVTMHRFI